MFKKSLLALTVASAAFGAQAGEIYSSVSLKYADQAAFITALGAAGADKAVGANAGLGGDENCKAAATAVGLTLGSDTTANAADGNNDTLSFANAAVASVFSAPTIAMTGANACTFTNGYVTSSSTAKSPVEQTGSILVDAYIVAGAGGFRKEDTIVIKFTGSKIDKNTVPTLAKLTGTQTTFSLLDITEDTIRYTVASGSAEDLPGKGIIKLTGVKLNTAGLTTGSKVNMEYYAQNTASVQYDVTSATAVHELVNQYSATVERKLDGIINVSDDRKSLKAEATTATLTKDALDQDTLTIKVVKQSTTNDVDAENITFTIDGNFEWLATKADTTNDGKAVTAAEVLAYLNTTGKESLRKDAAADNDPFVALTSATLSSDYKKLTLVSNTPSTATDVTGTYNLRLTVPGKDDKNPVLATQTFSASVAIDNGLTTGKITMDAVKDAAAGEWKLNGSVVTIPYMPFDDNTAVILRHTNTGVQTGDIAVRYMLEGVDTNWVDAGVVSTSSRGVKDIRDAVINAIKTKSGKTSGKAAIEITTNVPAADVTVFAGFKVKDESDRGIVGTFGHLGAAQNASNTTTNP